MSFTAGEDLEAARLNRLQTKIYYAIGSGSIAASQTNADVTDATVTFTTNAANATYAAICVWDYSSSAGPAAAGTARLNVDGANQSPLAVFNGSGSGDRGTTPQNYSGTLASAGSHTLKLIATTSTNMTVTGTNSSILVIVEEVV